MLPPVEVGTPDRWLGCRTDGDACEAGGCVFVDEDPPIVLFGTALREDGPA